MWFLFLIIGIVILDQATKYWAASALKSGDVWVILANIFEFRYAENRGAAWSILEGYPWLLLGVSVVMLGILIWNRSEFLKNGFWGKLALGLLIGGILGNFIDRLWHRYVIDFIQVYLPTLRQMAHYPVESYAFPTFNIADSAICLGVVAYGVMMVMESRKAG